jgi:hypothetical protein
MTNSVTENLLGLCKRKYFTFDELILENGETLGL